MKKILVMALIMTGGFFSAEAQAQGCKIATKKTAIHHAKNAQNFKVCKNDNGYQVCGETPTYANSTVTRMKMAAPQQATNQDMSYAQNQQDATTENTTPDALLAPQSQSYPAAATFGMNSEGAFEGYYPKKHYIEVTYSDNVAEETHAPYEGLPSPQYDGPAKNAARNLNESNENANLAPITGRKD